MTIVNQFLVTGIGAVAFFFLLQPILKQAAKPLGLLDIPSKRKLHAKPIPLIGGIGIVLAVLAGLLLTETGRSTFSHFAAIMSATGLILVMGILDDKLNLNAKHRLILQILAATIVAFFGVRIHTLGGIFGITELPLILQYVITVVIIAGVTNAFNLIDGVDGLAGSIALINYLILSIVAFFQGDLVMMILMVSMAMAHIAFLVKNWAPASIFMGDGGSMMNGFLLTTSAVWLLSNASNAAIGAPLLINFLVAMFLLPVVDAVRVFTYRYVLSVSIFTPDKSHLHHLLLLLNLPAKWVTLSLIGVHLAIIVGMFYLFALFGINVAIVVSVVLFIAFSKILSVNRKIIEWQERIKTFENQRIPQQNA